MFFNIIINYDVAKTYVALLSIYCEDIKAPTHGIVSHVGQAAVLKHTG